MTATPAANPCAEMINPAEAIDYASRISNARTRSAPVAPGIWHWRGNTDQPDTLRLDSMSYIGADGKRHLGESQISLLQHRLTDADAQRRQIGSWAAEEVPTTDMRDRGTGQVIGKVVGNIEVPFVHHADPRDFDDRYEEAFERESERLAREAIEQWLTDDDGEARTENRLAFVDDNGFLVDATTLPIYEVARDITDPDDPKVYRRDIVGLRHPVAEFLAHAKFDVDNLLGALDAVRDVLERSEMFAADAPHNPAAWGLREQILSIIGGPQAATAEPQCSCDGAAYYTAEQNAARIPFLVNPDCPVLAHRQRQVSDVKPINDAIRQALLADNTETGAGGPA